jgi:hypothetical protein
VNENRLATEDVKVAGHIGQQPTRHGTFAVRRDGWKSVLQQKPGEKRSLMRQKRIGNYQRCLRCFSADCLKCGAKFAQGRYLRYIKGKAQLSRDNLDEKD